MEVQFACVCDCANLSDGKLNVMGEFDHIWALQLPVTHPLMYFAAKIRLSVADGHDVAFHLRVIDGNGQLVTQPIEITAKVSAPVGETPTVRVVLPIFNAHFKEFGDYDFELQYRGKRAHAVNVVIKKAEKAL